MGLGDKESTPYLYRFLFFLFFCVNKRILFVREGIFLFYMSLHTHFFVFFLLLPLFIHQKVSWEFFCQSVLCSFLLHSCSPPSNLPLLHFSHTRVDINISLFVHEVRSSFFSSAEWKPSDAAISLSPFIRLTSFWVDPWSQAPVLNQQVEGKFSKNANCGWKEGKDKHGFRIAKRWKVKLALLNIVCMYGCCENSAKILHNYQWCWLIWSSSSLLRVFVLDFIPPSDCSGPTS